MEKACNNASFQTANTERRWRHLKRAASSNASGDRYRCSARRGVMADPEMWLVRRVPVGALRERRAVGLGGKIRQALARHDEVSLSCRSGSVTLGERFGCLITPAISVEQDTGRGNAADTRGGRGGRRSQLSCLSPSGPVICRIHHSAARRASLSRPKARGSQTLSERCWTVRQETVA